MITSESKSFPLTLTLFGPMRVLVGGQPLPRLRSRKALWLLALLALRHDRLVERAWLAGTLWPDVDQDRAGANLRVVLSELRKALGGEGGRLQSPARHTLRLDLAGADVDVLAFDTAVAGQTLPALERAAALYAGPLLEGCTEEWAPQERRVREEDCLRALETLAEAALTAGDGETAIRHHRRAVTIDPWREAAQRGLMEALSQGGDGNAALDVYQAFVRLLRKDDPRATPDEQTIALYARLRAGARRAAAPAPAAEHPALPTVTGFLPHPLTDLIGREDERAEVVERLRRSRLVTLTGPGGIGKTRLALAVAAEAAPGLADGAWLVALESLTEGRQVERQIASALGLKEAPGQLLRDGLTAHLRAKRLLLVLDNCEHLLDASARIGGHLLRECPGVRILATSREALGITGETAWAVPALAVPDPAHLPPGQATLVRVLAGYEGVQLFVERAQAAQKGFTLTAGGAAAVAQVCARLQGIPLAIELAAARIRSLTVEQIAARMDDHLGLLTGGSRTAQSRQQTLRATVDWSYDLLSGPERRLLGRLSVFAGGWTLAAAEGACAGDGNGGGAGIEPGQVLALLTSLVDKSLVVFAEREAGGRYRFLEMVRQYASEGLNAGGESGRVRAKHRDYFLALAEEGEPELKGAGQEGWLRRLEAEHDNLRAALAWCGAEEGGAAMGLRMAVALWQFWELHGYYNEGRAFLSEALGREQAGGRVIGRARALYAAGVLAFYQGDYPAARALYAEGLTIFRELGSKPGIASSLKDLGRVAGAQGDYPAAGALYEESLAISRELGDRQGSGWVLNDLGNLAGARGDYQAARALHEESLAISRELRDTEGIAWSLHHLGAVAGAQGDDGAARALHEESLASFRELGNKQGTAWALNYLGKVVGAQGDAGAAQSLYAEGLALFRELGNKQGVAWVLNDLGNLAETQGRHPAARALHEEGLRLQMEMGDKRGAAAGLRGLAALTPPASEKAARLWGAAESLRESIGARLFQSEQEKYDQQIARTRAALGEDAFSAAWEEGRALTMEQAAACALEEPPDLERV